MNYETFKKETVNAFTKAFPDDEVVEKKINKPNVVLDAIIVSTAGKKVSPTVYINDMFSRFEAENIELEEFLANEINRYENLEIPEFTDFADLCNLMLDLSRVTMELINSSNNENLLKDVVHRSFNDLSIIYRWVADSSAGGMASAIITNAMLERFGITEEELYVAAIKNSEDNIFIMSIEEQIVETMGVPRETLPDVPACETMWVMSNQNKLFGAIAMLHSNKLMKLANKLNSDLYILPSSIHEILCVSAEKFFEVDKLREMVQEVNDTEVAKDELLSYCVYKFSRDTKTVTIA